MKCDAPQPDSAWRSCDQPIGHLGDHKYLGKQWPRLESREMDWAVRDLLDDVLEPHGDEWRRYPVRVRVTYEKVLMVEGSSEEAARRSLGRSDWCDLDLGTSDAGNWDMEIERDKVDEYPDELTQVALFGDTSPRFGPVRACVDCGGIAPVYSPDTVRHASAFLRCHGPWSFWPSGMRK